VIDKGEHGDLEKPVDLYAKVGCFSESDSDEGDSDAMEEDSDAAADGDFKGLHKVHDVAVKRKVVAAAVPDPLAPEIVERFENMFDELFALGDGELQGGEGVGGAAADAGGDVGGGCDVPVRPVVLGDDAPLRALAPLPPPPPEPLAARLGRPRAGDRARIGAGVEVEGHLDEYITQDFGCIKIDRKRKSLNAHCSCLGRPGDLQDHRTFTTPECRFNRAPEKAPLGLLIAWLRLGGGCDDRATHVELKTSLGTDLRRRQQAREWLEGQPALRPLLAFEAEALGKDVGSVREPLVIA